MKKHYINDRFVSKVEFAKQLQRCCVRIGGLSCDVTRLAGIRDKLRKGWTYTCLYPARNIRMTFRIEIEEESRK